MAGNRMTSLFILVYPDDRLRIKAAPVLQFDAVLKKEVSDLIETMYQDHGVGLAATQVNIHKRIFVMDCSADQKNRFASLTQKLFTLKVKF